MATEVFTGYTEVDPNSKITITAPKIAVAALATADTAYVYKDKGVDHFSGDFEHLLEVYGVAANDDVAKLWALANDIGASAALIAASKNFLFLDVQPQDNSQVKLFLVENYSGGYYYDYKTGLSPSTPYYLKIKRDESVGTYGTLYCYIYSDSDRTSLVDTLEIALHAKLDFRYIYGLMGKGAAGDAFTGYVQNLDLQEAAPPAVGFSRGFVF